MRTNHLQRNCEDMWQSAVILFFVQIGNTLDMMIFLHLSYNTILVGYGMSRRKDKHLLPLIWS